MTTTLILNVGTPELIIPPAPILKDAGTRSRAPWRSTLRVSLLSQTRLVPPDARGAIHIITEEKKGSLIPAPEGTTR